MHFLCLYLAGRQRDNPAETGDFDYCLDLLLSVPHIDVHLTNQAGETALHIAATRGYVLGLRQLVAAQADINARNRHQETPLFCAGSAECLQWILGQDGMDLEAKDCDGNTALHKFAQDSSVPADLLGLLITKGADVNAVNDQGESALFITFLDIMQFS